MAESLRRTGSMQELACSENLKMFDNYGPVEVREALGTVFLGVLAILIFASLVRLWSHYEAVFDRRQATLLARR